MKTRRYAVLLLMTCVVTASAARAERNGGYEYGGAAFGAFIADSLTRGKAGAPKDFYAWMNREYAKAGVKFRGRGEATIERMLESSRAELAAPRDAGKKTALEMETAAYLHKMVKKTIPQFSLDRGFEFHNVLKYGERQCFLQSVLLAAMLQKIGADAGVVMVFRNIAGQYSNNGHAAVLLKLSNGRDIIVDASEPEPFARHTGVFARSSGYKFLFPVFEKGKDTITGYEAPGGGKRYAATGVRALDYDFLNSQFWYYRGERAPGGLLSPSPGKSGLEKARRALATSVKLCPENPLAVYMLGRAELALGDKRSARNTLGKAVALYTRFGWAPPGPKAYLKEAGK